MDQSNQGYRILEGDETNFFAAEENHHSLDAATAAAVAQAVGPAAVQGHPGLDTLNNSILDAHNVNPEIPGLKHHDQHAPPPGGLPHTSDHHHRQQQHPPLPVTTTTTGQIPPQLPTTNHHQQQHLPHVQQQQQQPQTHHHHPDDAEATAIAAGATLQPPQIETGTAKFYACPVRHCQFLGKKVPEIQRHMGRNQHKGIENRTCAGYNTDQAFIPAALQNTAMVVDRDYKLAVCRNGSYILSKNEIPAHCQLCVMCQGFDQSLTDQPDYQEIADFVDLEPFKQVQPLAHHGAPLDPKDYEAGMLRRIAGTYRDDNEDNDKRFLCVPCYTEGKLFTMGRKDGNHVFNIHKINPDDRASAWVACRGMSYRLLGKGFCDQSKFYVAVKSDR